MNKIFNIIIVCLFASLAALLIYKTVKEPPHYNASLNSKAVIKSSDTDASGTMSKESLEKAIQEYILAHPESIIASLEGLQKKKYDEISKKASEYLKTNLSEIQEFGIPPVIGNPSGDVTIVLFYDYKCSFCKKASQVLTELVSMDKNVKIVLRPIAVLGEESDYATKVALAVNKISEEKFVNIHNKLMEIDRITGDKVKTLLSDNYIDYGMFENEMNSYSLKQSMHKNAEFTKHLGMKGAPSYVVGSNFFSGLLDLDKIVSLIAEARAELHKGK